MVAYLPLQLVTLHDCYPKGRRFPSLPHVSCCALSHCEHVTMSHQANYLVFWREKINQKLFHQRKRNKSNFLSSSQDLKCFYNNHICTWVAIDHFSDFICSTCHVLAMLASITLSVWFGLVLWHINLCRLFNTKSIFM